jgi:hypothetical protein
VHDKASDAPVLLSNLSGSSGIGSGANEFFLLSMLGTLERYEESTKKTNAQ